MLVAPAPEPSSARLLGWAAASMSAVNRPSSPRPTGPASRRPFAPPSKPVSTPAGTGIKNKVLEAAAAGLAVVTTRRGLGDIDLVPGSEVLVVDDAAGLAAAAVEPLRSPARRAAMGAAARARIASAWTWAATARAFADLSADVAAHPTRSATWR